MTDPSVNVAENARQAARTLPSSTGSPTTAGLGAGLRSLGARQCPNCGAHTSDHTSVCPECGESLQRRARKIRCLRCGQSASSELTLCPHCGRELRPAPPRLLTLGAPAALVALFLLVMILRWDNGNPLVWARDRLAAGFTVVGGRIEPEIVLVVTPLAPDREVGHGEGPGAALAIESAYRAQTQLQGAPANPPASDNAEGGNTEGGGTGDGSAPAAADGAAVVDLPTATATEASTATPEATATPAPTQTPEPTATAEATLEPTPATIDYVVSRGDTLVTIAARYDVDVDELMAANDISERDVFVIQPGQVLVIPAPPTPTAELPTPTVESSTPEPTPTPDAAPTARPQPTASSSPSSAQGGMRLEAPVLLGPADGARVSCDEAATLRWQRVPFVRDSDKYVLHLGFVGGRSAGGSEQIVWILAQSRPVTSTEWALDKSLCGLAPAQYDHQWRWWVEVVGDSDGKPVQVSPASETWGFVWE